LVKTPLGNNKKEMLRELFLYDPYYMIKKLISVRLWDKDQQIPVEKNR